MRARSSAGMLRKLISIEIPLTTIDEEFGDTIESFAAPINLWADIEPVSGRDNWSAERLEDVVTHSLCIRWRDDVTPGCRVAYQDRSFRIIGLFDPEERQRWLVLHCEEIKS